LWVGIGLGTVNLALQAFGNIFTGGGASVAIDGGAAAAEVTATTIVRTIFSRVLSTFTTKAGLQSVGRFVVDNGKSIGVQAGLTAIATILARFIVLANMGTMENATAVGVPFANSADNGANQMSNSMMCQQYYGRFLTNAEAVKQNEKDAEVVRSYNASHGTFQRYFAISNANSLTSHIGYKMMGTLNRGFFANALDSFAKVFNPTSIAPRIFGSFNSKAAAAGNVDTANYGNVQCGWTDDEYGIIQGNLTYKSVSENEYVLSQREDEVKKIEEKYDKCFTEEIGTLLEHKDIIRNDAGDVNFSRGDCSPQQLGPKNPQYGDLVFRYRIYHNRASTMDMYQEYDNVESVTQSPTAL